jgi:DNA-binding GntR family transcriptional regulator
LGQLETPIQATRKHRETLGEAAYRTVRRDIIRCVLPPGLQVSKVQLAERYGMSQGVLRPALDRLAQEGLVKILRSQGYLITPITLGDVQDLLGTRVAVEPVATRLAAGKLTNHELAHLREQSQLQYDQELAGDISAAEATNLELHLTIARASGLERLAAQIAALIDEAERLWHFGLDLKIHGGEERCQHLAIVDALATGDGGLAARAMEAHLESVRSSALTALSRNRSFRGLVLSTGSPRTAADGVFEDSGV